MKYGWCVVGVTLLLFNGRRTQDTTTILTVDENGSGMLDDTELETSTADITTTTIIPSDVYTTSDYADDITTIFPSDVEITTGFSEDTTTTAVPIPQEVAAYTFSNSDTSTSIHISFLLYRDTTVWIVCSFISTNNSLFQDSSRLPTIYLVRGYTTCANLPNVVQARKLGEIVHSGNVTRQMSGLTWEQLQNNCILLVRKIAEQETEIGEGEEITTTNSPEETTYISEDVAVTTDGATTISDLSPRDLRRDLQSILTIFPLTRSFTSLDLSSFTLISSGFTTAFNLPSVTVYKPNVVFPTGGISVPYNKWSTLPYLQLPGWSGATSYYIAWSMFGLYYLYALLGGNPLNSLATISRRIASLVDDRSFSTRANNLQAGVADDPYQAFNNFDPHDNWNQIIKKRPKKRNFYDKYYK